MYGWFREIHLIAGLCALPFVLMYGVSAIQMSHPSWFKNEAQVTGTRATVAPEKVSDGRSVARELMAQGLVSGEIGQIRTTPQGFRLRINRPGGFFDVEYDRVSGAAVISSSRNGIFATLNRVHHIASVHYQYWLMNVWGALLGLTALGFFTVAASGACMWLQMPRERSVGVVLLVIALGYSLSVLVAIRMAD
jgi:hypothetical protein